MRLKLCKNLRTTSLGQNLPVLYIKKRSVSHIEIRNVSCLPADTRTPSTRMRFRLKTQLFYLIRIRLSSTRHIWKRWSRIHLLKTLSREDTATYSCGRLKTEFFNNDDVTSVVVFFAQFSFPNCQNWGHTLQPVVRCLWWLSHIACFQLNYSYHS